MFIGNFGLNHPISTFLELFLNFPLSINMEEAIIDQLSGKNGHYLHNTTLYFEIRRSLVFVPESSCDYTTTTFLQSYHRVLIAFT